MCMRVIPFLRVKQICRINLLWHNCQSKPPQFSINFYAALFTSKEFTMFETAQMISVAAVLTSFVVGYKYGNRLSNKNAGKSTNSRESSELSSSNEEEENVFSDAGNGDCKMILVVRNDLKMGKGKIAAQCGHAAVGAFENARKNPTLLRKWRNSGQAKIAVKVESEEKLMEVYKLARQKNLNCCLIRDAGRTQIEPNSKTVLAIGPAPNKVLDEVTGRLKLL